MIIYKFWKIIINLNSPNKYGLAAENLNNMHQQHKIIIETSVKDFSKKTSVKDMADPDLKPVKLEL